MSFVTQEFTLASAVADAGTVAVTPTGYTQADFTGTNASATGVVIVNDNEVYQESDSDVSMSYGASSVTITNDSGVTWAAGDKIRVQFGQAGADRPAFAKADAITSFTDNSGGTAANTIAAIGASYDQAEVRNAVASLAAKTEEILTVLRTKGLIEE